MAIMIFNRMVVWLLQSRLHWLLSRSFVVMHVVGVKSGRIYNVPVNYIRLSPSNPLRLLITSLRARTWWRNLRQQVEVEITLEGRRQPVFAQAYESEADVVAGFVAYFASSPRSARYFKVELSSDGKASEADLQALAEKHVVIRIEPQRSI